jgi:hypothetical protein
MLAEALCNRLGDLPKFPRKSLLGSSALESDIAVPEQSGAPPVTAFPTLACTKTHASKLPSVGGMASGGSTREKWKMQYLGTVVHHHPYKKYGFIEVENGDRYYFHESECDGAFDWTASDQGSDGEAIPRIAARS